MLKKTLLLTLLPLLSVSISNAQCTSGNCYDGRGSFLFENGDLYDGLWRKGEANGYGVYEFANGDVFKGHFEDGAMEGRGTYTYKNGDKYIGEWKDGLMDGRGHFHWSLPGDLMTNAKYEGFFKAGVPQNIDIPATVMPAEPPKMK